RSWQEWRVQHERRVAANDLHALPIRCREAAVELGKQAASEEKLADEGPIHAALVEAREGIEALRLLSGQPAREADWVAANIPERPSAHLWADPRIDRIGEEERERPAQQLQATKCPASRELEGEDGLRMVQEHEALDGGPASALTGGDDLVHRVD